MCAVGCRQVSSRTVADCKHYMAIKDCSQEGKMKSAEDDDWTLEEDKMLRDLADRYAEPNWVSVAEKLGVSPCYLVLNVSRVRVVLLSHTKELLASVIVH